MRRIIPGILLLLLVFCFDLRSQNIQLDSLEATFHKVEGFLLYRQYDTNYVHKENSMVGLKVNTLFKYNFFELSDREMSRKIRYRPDGDLYLGLGVVYKWLSIDLNISSGIRSGDKEELNRRTFDFQGAVYTSKQMLSATVQYYRAYRFFRAKGSPTPVPDSVHLRQDLRTVNMELQYLHALNYTKFSLKAPFVMTEVQRKSAGSPVFGIAFSVYTMSADSSILPVVLQPEFRPQANLSGLTYLNLGVSLGYMYTWVINPKWFLTVSMIPGMHFNSGDYSTTALEEITPNLNFKLRTKNAFGYNGDRFFAGLNFTYNTIFTRVERKLTYQVGFGQTTLFVGYRFKNKKKK